MDKLIWIMSAEPMEVGLTQNKTRHALHALRAVVVHYYHIHDMTWEEMG